MQTITEHTTIASLLKQEPAALDAIVSVSSRFNLLRNPVMRKLMAGRTTIAMATKIAGVSAQSFFEKLTPLGFRVESVPLLKETDTTAQQKPAFMIASANQQLEFDVRPILKDGRDPLKEIHTQMMKLQTGQVLMIINSFEPTPLIELYKKKGFEIFVEQVNEKLVHTYFHRVSTTPAVYTECPVDSSGNWDDCLQRFVNKISSIDVRMLEMPQPMLTILGSLQSLPKGHALLVHHKRVPVFLLPHLDDGKFDYLVKKSAGEEVQMLIYHREC